MQIDPNNWHACSVNELAGIFSSIGVSWWISGGWAIDLFLGRQTREHEDIDVQILRVDQLIAQRHLSDWQLFKTNQPGLAPWPEGEHLVSPVNCVWARRNDRSPWAFEIMFMESEGTDWVYRRMPEIRGNLSHLGLQTGDGIPYLAPEIQLLYKAVPEYREKDLDDLRSVLPCLPKDRVRWLLDSLRRQYPQGHDWIAQIERFSD